MSISGVGETGSVQPPKSTQQVIKSGQEDGSYEALASNPLFKSIHSLPYYEQDPVVLWNVMVGEPFPEIWILPPTIENFLTTYLRALGTGITESNLEDWVDCIKGYYTDTASSYLAQEGLQMSEEQLEGLFDIQFQKFVEDYYAAVKQGSNTGITTLESFLDAFDHYAATLLSVNVASYAVCLDFLDIFFPDPADQQEMEVKLEELFRKYFYEADGGAIDYNAFIDEWYTLCVNTYVASLKVEFEADPAADSYDKTQLIFDIYRILRRLVGEIQLLTAAQTEYQTFLTKLDGAYNKMIADIPLTVDADIPGGDEDKKKEVKADAQMVEQRWTEDLRSRQSEVQDLLKQLQTLLGQSNEATNQAGNFIAQFIQTLQGMLNAIYR
jgi:hypothetical protein